MSFTFSPLQFSNDVLSLLEWFLLAVALVVVVTLIYVYVLNKSPPPAGVVTVEKIENAREDNLKLNDPSPFLAESQQSLQAGNFAGAVESSVLAVGAALKQILGLSNTESMSISDMAYLAESRSRNVPPFSSSVYQLNNLRLRVLQGQAPTQEEASWSVTFANWFVNTLAPHAAQGS